MKYCIVCINNFNRSYFLVRLLRGPSRGLCRSRQKGVKIRKAAEVGKAKVDICRGKDLASFVAKTSVEKKDMMNLGRWRERQFIHLF